MCAAVTTLAAMAALSLTATAARAATTLCNSQTASVAGGAYMVENNEWNSSASECITTDGNADFTVANSSISLSGGAPGGYPAIYKGCHWGECTTDSGLPIQVGSLTPGKVTTQLDHHPARRRRLRRRLRHLVQPEPRPPPASPTPRR